MSGKKSGKSQGISKWMTSGNPEVNVTLFFGKEAGGIS